MAFSSKAKGSDWTITRLAGSLGAELTGLSLKEASPEGIDAIKAALNEHMVLFFPGQDLSVDEHVGLGRHFGPLEGHPHLQNAFSDHPELFELAASKGGIADEWHTDLTFQTQPSVMSVLKMVKCPASGGDTSFANMRSAYRRLSPSRRTRVERLRCVSGLDRDGASAQPIDRER